MTEYHGEGTINFTQSRGKKYILFPALERNLNEVSNRKLTLLDVGCGRGEIAAIASSKGYEYLGLDDSADMLTIARQLHPMNNFIKGDAKDLSKIFHRQFDVIIASMLFLSMDKFDKIVSILTECKKVLKQKGTVLVGITHPCFDNYMQKFLFNRHDTETNYSGYFSSGATAKTIFTIDSEQFTFTDFHWTFTDYLSAAHSSGMYIANIDECKLNLADVTAADKNWAGFRVKFPSYLILILKIRNQNCGLF